MERKEEGKDKSRTLAFKLKKSRKEGIKQAEMLSLKSLELNDQNH